MANQHYKLNINVNPVHHSTPAKDPATPAPEQKKQPVPEPESEPAAPPPEPEIRLKSAQFEPHPVNGYSVNKACVITGLAEFLKHTVCTRCTVKLFSIYNGVETDLGLNPATNGATNINTTTGEFKFSEINLYIPQDYPDVEAFSSAIRYKAVIQSERCEKPIEIFLDLPDDSVEPAPDLKLKMYDDHAVEKYKNQTPVKYPAGGEGYVKGTPVHEYQLTLERFRYLTPETANGVFGPKTDEATKKFQKDCQDKLRVLKAGGKLITIPSISFKGTVDGVVGQKTRDEIALWRREDYLRPLPNLYHGDYDQQAVSNGIKSDTQGNKKDAQTQRDDQQDDYHDTGTPVLEFQKLLAEIGAYDGKQDGWFADKTKVAIEYFQECAEKGEFIDANGNPVILPEEERMAKAPKGSASILVQETAKKTAEKKLKVAPKGALSDSVGQGGKNKPEDVKKVKSRLKELGYPVKDGSETLSPEDIKAISFFQAQIITIPSDNGAPAMPDGIISSGKNTEKKLFASDAPKYAPPSKGSEKPIEKGIQDKITAAKDAAADKWEKIKEVWKAVSPYLPEGSKMSSGYRTDAEQRAIVWTMYNITYKERILDKYGEDVWQKYKDMQGVDDAQADPVMCKQIKEAAAQDVAVPGRSNHRYGKAIDVGGTPDNIQVRNLLWCSVQRTDEIKVTKIIKERNGCVHFEFT